MPVRKTNSNFFRDIQTTPVNGVSYKNVLLKKEILDLLIKEGTATAADIGKAINASTPKINELLAELIVDGILKDYGKSSSGVGRKPNSYGLEATSAYFTGIEVNRKSINIGLMDFCENFIQVKNNIEFDLEDSQQSLTKLCEIIDSFISKLSIRKDKISGIGINLTGRINHKTGYSYSFFNFSELPLSQVIEDRIGIPTFLENDSRAMAFGEFYSGVVNNESDVLFINLDEGVGMGIMIGGELYYGKSGYAGEFGHIPIFNNDIICHCGKKGCLETEASGIAITNRFKAKLADGATSILTQSKKNLDDIKLQDIIDAALHDDMLAIDIISDAGEKIGRGIAILINLYNPELIILGGTLAETDALIRLPIKSAINKYSLTLVNTDTELKMSKLGKKAGVVGACLLVRNKVLTLPS